MTEKQRIDKYIQEHCKNCKNKDKEDCEIRVFQCENETVTKCDYYEKKN